MADLVLLALTALALLLSAPMLIDTKNILRLDVAAGLLTLTWLIPQAYALRYDPFSWYYDLSFTYGYIFACIAFLAIGSLIGRRLAENRLAHRPASLPVSSNAQYDPDKLGTAAILMTAFGGMGFVLMARESQNFGAQEQWTGVITLYYLLSQFMIFGGTLGILVYMQYKKKRGLLAYFAMLFVATPVFLFFIRRSVLFQIAAVTLGAVVLNRSIRIPRTLLISGLVVSVLILNGAGAIRQHVIYEGGTIVSAFTEGVMFKANLAGGDVVAAELKSAVSDIEIARSTNQYRPFVMLWNIAVSQYVPGFLVGDQTKASFLIADSNASVQQSYFADGATRTGFAESFSGYWYFGPFIYLAIGILFGRLWVLTNMRDIKAQHTYLVFLLYSLLTITESISRIVVISPIIMSSIWLSFKFAQRKPTAQSATGPMSLPG